jgi:hypothetical protein
VRISVGVLITALALSGAATGCGRDGGGPKPLTKDAFIAQATRICRSGNKQQAKVERRKATNRREAADIVASGLVIERRMVAELRQLSPPEAMRARWAKYLSLQQRLITTVRKLVEEVRKGPLDSVESSMNTVRKVDGRAGDIVYGLGIHSCAPR